MGGCQERVPGEGAMGGCHGRVPWEGAMGGCHGRVPWEGAMGGCHGRVPSGLGCAWWLAGSTWPAARGVPWTCGKPSPTSSVRACWSLPSFHLPLSPSPYLSHAPPCCPPPPCGSLPPCIVIPTHLDHVGVDEIVDGGHWKGLDHLGMDEFIDGGYWKGELYIDDGKRAYRALQLKSISLWQVAYQLLFDKTVKKSLGDTANVKGDLAGDGL
ncbi:unnamed protein product [Closterium sp. NIES-64]|nr:unnamed protein product [Closterium sp. NIES-64]